LLKNSFFIYHGGIIVKIVLIVIIPYIVPEIFNGTKFSKESNIYSIGMNLTTGCKTFADIEHDHKLGKLPKITMNTP